MKHSHLFLLPLYGSCLLTACGGGGSSDPAAEPATHLTVTAPTTATAGTAFRVTVTALDATNKTVAGYSGTVHFSSTDRQAALSSNSRLTNGTGSFSATLGSSGSQTITATDTVAASIAGTSSAIDVSDPPTHFSVSAPSTAGSGTSFKLTVTALDATNKIVAGYSGTVHFSSTDRQAMLPANSKLTNGAGAFSATLRTEGRQTITTNDTVAASISGTSNSIAVSVYRNCIAEGAQCLSSYPPCCPGLACQAATTRAYCEPISAAAGAMASKAEARLAALFPPRAVPMAMHHHYKLIDLGTFGGPRSSVTTEPTQEVINSAGVIVGGADTAQPTPEPDCYNPIFAPDCFIVHAFEWKDDHLRDLGTLPGGNYSFALETNERGQIVGASETNQVDPSTGSPEFHAVLWEKDKIHDLGTLGGTASFAEVLNNHGKIVGNSLNDVPDPLSIMGVGSSLTLTQTHGFIWQDGKMRDLGTLGGPDSWASFVNERGQVAGASYTNDVVDPNTGTPQIDLFIWEDGRMKDLGNLGGNSGSTVGAPGVVSGINNMGEITGQMAPAGDQVFDAFLWNGHELRDLGTLGGNFSSASAINDAGEVVGYADIAEPNGYHHGFLWRGGEMIDLGTLGSDTCSDALALNSRGQVAGASQSAAGACGPWTTAFLWENNGPMVDLNSLVPSGSGVHLVAAEAINEKGEIVAAGAPPGCDVLHADPCQHIYALIPCDHDHPVVDGCDYSLVDTDPATVARSTKGTLPPSSTPNAPKLSMHQGRARGAQLAR